MYLIYVKFKATYDGNHDTFRVEFLVVPVGGLAFLVNHDFSPLEVRNSALIYSSYSRAAYVSKCALNLCSYETVGSLVLT